jgi:hypothetical protein
LAPFPDEDLPQLQAARRDARLMADQTVGAWMDGLEVESEHHPVFLLLEDLMRDKQYAESVVPK